MRRPLSPTIKRLLIAGLLLAFGQLPAQDDSTWVELTQSEAAVLAHQRLAGNARAQAKRQGAIRSVPHLFVYHRDGSPAFHMDGLRVGFERQLALLIEAFRIDRSMVQLETLLENAETSGGATLTPADLPPGRVTLVLYTGPDCSTCEAVQERLEDWLQAHPALNPNRIRIRMP